jgi:hypothetical protein
MKKIENWDDIEVKEFNESEKFTLGGKRCKIVNVKNFTYNGIEKVSLELDIIEGENSGYYQKKYDERNENSKFWDDGATISFPTEPTEEKDKSYIKGLIKAIESYNPNYKWNWDEQSLKDKFINANFSLKEYQGSDGNIYTKPQVYRFVNSKENFKEDYIPSVRTIDNGYVKYEEYIEMSKVKNNNSTDPFEALEDVVEISDDILD